MLQVSRAQEPTVTFAVRGAWVHATDAVGSIQPLHYHIASERVALSQRLRAEYLRFGGV